MQKDNFPKIPPLPHITGKELFEDDKKAEEWFHALTLRRAALANLIASTQASMYSKDGSPDAEEFVIVSPCTDGVYRYQLTKFDKFGPVYDEKKKRRKRNRKRDSEFVCCCGGDGEVGKWIKLGMENGKEKKKDKEKIQRSPRTRKRVLGRFVPKGILHHR